MPPIPSAPPESPRFQGENLTAARERLIRLLRDSDSATRTLAAFSGGPIELSLRDRHERRPTPAERAELDVETENSEPTVQHRVIELHNRDRGTLSEAVVAVLLDRLPDEYVTNLRHQEIPLGLVLAPLLPRRHTVAVTRNPAEPTHPGSVLFEITARLDIAGRPVALVHERYLAGALVV